MYDGTSKESYNEKYWKTRSVPLYKNTESFSKEQANLFRWCGIIRLYFKRKLCSTLLCSQILAKC